MFSCNVILKERLACETFLTSIAFVRIFSGSFVNAIYMNVQVFFANETFFTNVTYEFFSDSSMSSFDVGLKGLRKIKRCFTRVTIMLFGCRRSMFELGMDGFTLSFSKGLVTKIAFISFPFFLWGHNIFCSFVEGTYVILHEFFTAKPFVTVATFRILNNCSMF